MPPIQTKSGNGGAAQAAKRELNEQTSSCMRLARRPFSLTFKSRAVEQNYILEVASGRRPVFIATGSFDLALLLLRVIVSAFTSSQEGTAPGVLRILLAGLFNLVVLYSLIGVVYRRSQRSGVDASRAEILLATLISGVLCRLTSSNSPNSWIFLAFFLICTSTVLRLRWLIGAAALAAPVLLTIHQNLRITYLLPLDSFTTGACLASEQGCIVTLLKSIQLSSVGHLPVHTVIHLVVAWAAGTLMGFISDDSRRQSFTSHRMALTAAATEVAEVRARVAAEKELASAQALAQAKSLLVDRERASNEAKSEFISMLCHEIRTPLNGCLASAEMLLQTDLDEDQKDLAYTVRVSGSILLSTVSNFLDFFKLEAGKSLDIVRTPLDVGMLVADVHRIIEAMVVGDGAVKLLEPDLNGTPRTALGDPARLCGILLNMYMNAAKFTKTGSIGLKVRVVAKDYRPAPPPMVVVEDVTEDLATRNGSSYNNRSSSPANEEEEEDQNNRTGGREMNGSSGDSSSGDGSNASEASSSSQHGSRNSLTNIVDDMETAAEEYTTSATTTTAPAAAASITMSIKDEGDGWLSTASAPQLPNASSINFPTSSNTEDELRWVSFEVHDTGVGIAPKSLSALFHDYVQGDDDEMEKPRTRSGTGLGLAICGKQVAVLGGVIGALTKPGVGSIFWFKVPMLIPPQCEEEEEVGEDTYEEERMEYNNGGADGCADMNNGASGGGSGELTFENNAQFAAAAINFTGATPFATTNNNPNTAISKRMSSGGLPQVGSDLFLDGWGLEPRWNSSDPAAAPGTTPGTTPRPSISSQQGYTSNNTNSISRRQSCSQDLTAAPSTGAPSFSLEGIKVLVVEDNLINRKVACRVLQSLGVECEIASNGQEAVDIIAAMMEQEPATRRSSADAANDDNNNNSTYKKLDVVLMDMCMPVMNGIEATKAIRALGCTLPIVAMTANAEDKDKEQCLAAGMNGFLSKPVLREQLAACIVEATCSSSSSDAGDGEAANNLC